LIPVLFGLLRVLSVSRIIKRWHFPIWRCWRLPMIYKRKTQKTYWTWIDSWLRNCLLRYSLTIGGRKDTMTTIKQIGWFKDGSSDGKKRSHFINEEFREAGIDLKLVKIKSRCGIRNASSWRDNFCGFLIDSQQILRWLREIIWRIRMEILIFY